MDAEEEKGTEPQKKDRKRIVFGAAAVAVAVLVAGGVCAHRVYESHRTSVAREACRSAVADLGKATRDYKALPGADATAAALKKAAGAETPAMVACDASDRAGLDEAAARADKAMTSVKADARTLTAAVKAVESSRLDKTVADAVALYKATDGKVKDAKTRDALAKAVKSRDAEAIAKAVKAVNDSKAAKEKADAEAKAKAEQEAAEQAAAQQAAGSAGGSVGTYSGGSTGSYSTGNSGSYGTQRSSGQSSATQAPQQSQQQSGGACPNGAVCGTKPNMNSQSSCGGYLGESNGWHSSCSVGPGETYYW